MEQPFEGAHFGDFTIEGHGIRFHVLTAQTDSASDGYTRFSQLRYLFDYGSEPLTHNPNEPTFVIGDYNIDHGLTNILDLEAMAEIRERARIFTWCAIGCRNRDLNAFEGGTKIHIAQVGFGGRLRQVGALVGEADGSPSTTFYIISLKHFGSAIRFQIENVPGPQPNPCPLSADARQCRNSCSAKYADDLKKCGGVVPACAISAGISFSKCRNQCPFQ